MRATRALVAVGLSLMSAGAPDPLWAQGAARKNRVAVVDVDTSAEEQEREPALRKAVADAFAQHPGAALLPEGVIEEERRAVLTGAERGANEALARARGALSQGRAAYAKLNLVSAVESLSEARRLFILNLPYLRSNRDLIDTHLYLGMALAASGRKSEAREEFRRVIYLDPRKTLSSREYSPKVAEMFTQTRQAVMQEEPLQIRITSEPAGGDVYLNGRRMGEAPLDLKLQPGEYFLLVEKGGLKPWYRPVNLQRDFQSVRAVLEADARFLEWAGRFGVREGDRQAGPEVDQLAILGRKWNVDFVFLGSLAAGREYRLMGQLFDPRGVSFSPVAVINLGAEAGSLRSDARDLVAALLEFVGPDGRFLSSQRPDLSTPTENAPVADQKAAPESVITTEATEKPWYKHWWIWPIVAAAGVGIYLGATQLGGSDGGGIVIDNGGNF